MRLIDADALKGVMIETLEKIKANPKMDNQEAHVIAAFHTVGLMIDDAPTVDAVPVVRCGERRHYDHYMGSSIGSGVCSREKRKMNPIVDCDWYCADGERREE